MKPVRKSAGSFGNNSNNYNDRGWGSIGAPGVSSHTTSLASTSVVSRHRRPKAVNPASPPTTIELRGVPIHFPFKPYKCQEDYMGVVLDALLRRENALLESPTGTGKTLCLLCACLAWQREQARLLQAQPELEAAAAATAAALPDGQSSEQARKHFNRVPTIIYASRTHSQLSQVVRELRNTRYRPKHAVLGSREQMCVNPKVKKATSTASTINHDCSAMAKERKCTFRNRLDGFTAPSNESSTGAWYGTQPVMDMEDLVTMGKNHKVCPFYYTRNLVEDAELVLVPYNYLFDKDSRNSTLADIPWKNAVVIFDEAHNLESFASESASFDLSSKDIGGCISEVDKAILYIESDPDRFGANIKRDHLLRLKGIFMNFEEYIITKLPANQTAYRGEKMMDIFEKGANITYTTYTLILDLIKKLFEIFMEIRGGNNKGAPHLEHFSQCLKRVFGESSEARCLAKAESYRVHVTPPQSAAQHVGHRGGAVGRTVSYWCFAPSEAMRELQELEVRSILVTSGTLSPLESYAMELDLPFPNRLENPHIISPDQIHVRIIGKGVSNKILNSSYERRQDADYYIELGNTLATLSRIIPAGMLIFFPSYGVMETAIERWGGPASRAGTAKSGVNNFFAKRQVKASGSGGNSARYSFPQQRLDTNFSSTGSSTPWKRLLSNKSIIIEPKSSSDLPDAIEEFHKFLNMPKSKGVALFGVCRGKISEGIDFAHDMCRAVIITGLPFAPSFDPKVKMKREFLDQNRAKQHTKASTTGGFGAQHKGANACLSGHEWYQQQAHRAVNQAVGRVIRNKRDYGAVLLLDSRFELPGNQNGLSKWVRPHILPDEGFGRANHSLVQFYKKAQELEAKLEREVPCVAPTNVSRILEYENEGKENNHSETLANEEEFTKVAFIYHENNDKNADAAPTGETETDIPSKSYIPKHQIIATVDICTNEGSKIASQVLKGEIRRSELSSLSLSSTQSSLPSQNEGDTRNTLPTPSAFVQQSETNQKGNASETPARRFFDAVQATMSRDEFSSIKKAVVLMKKYTRMKDQKDFIAATREVIKIILNHENFENRPKDKKPDLLMLIIQLLPKHFVDAGRQCTMDLVFCGTTIRDELKAGLPHDQYMKVHISFVKFLTDLWFDNSRIDERKVATAFSGILGSSVNNGVVTASSLSAMTKIVPKEAQRVTNAITCELIESLPNAKPKVTVSITATDSGGRNRVDLDSTATAAIGSQRYQARSESKSEVATTNKPYSRNPYARSMVEATDNSHTTSQPNKMSAYLNDERKKRGLDQNASTSFSLTKILKQSASEVYTGKANTRTISDFYSNAPRDLNCTICDRRMDQPFISDCGHMACISCWHAWLGKTGTCAHCRKSVDPKTLALAVFKASSIR
ncbi:helicase associated domain containing protein [Nitzschia inconspicua]|uniref:Helicase associated domain containing protein n=1 Tax=Nitzschia inconspicua TaxID=303405 RepID=A0A9K3KF35_9STRA|nr:helicase associated domain containing protein [Nitzschia inconspicua]